MTVKFVAKWAELNNGKSTTNDQINEQKLTSPEKNLHVVHVQYTVYN